MEKWLIVHNCNTLGIAHSIHSLCSDIQADTLDVWQFRKNIAAAKASFSAYDRIVTYPEAQIVIDALEETGTKFSILPHVVFPAYHPDICYVYDASDVHLPGPLGNYHSTIGLAAYKLGANLEEALALFKLPIFEKAGFLDLWDQSEKNFIKKFSDYQIDVKTNLRKSANGKCFMYSHNHAKIEIVFETTKAFLKNEGYKIIEGTLLPADPQINGPAYPVYPEIAERYGFQGSYRFKIPGQFRYIDLNEFLKKEFEAFDTINKGDLKVSPEFEENYENVRSVLMDAR